MRRIVKLHLLLAILFGIGVSGCIKEKTLSPIPAIVFQSWDWVKLDTTASVTISFTDGDGDVGGGTVNDSTAPYNVQSPPYYDFIMVYYYQDPADKKFKRYYSPQAKDSLSDAEHIMNLTPSGPDKSLTGQINFSISGPFGPPSISGSGKPMYPIFRYDVFIYDRAGHKSNVVSTPVLQIL
jgi:hypothetical protein